MKTLVLCFLLLLGAVVSAQQQTSEMSFAISVSEEVKAVFQPEGRLFIYVSEAEEPAPRFSSVFGGGQSFAKNIQGWDSSQVLNLEGNDELITTADWDFNSVPEGDYFVQVLWKQNDESRSNTPHNLYSKPVFIQLQDNQNVDIALSEIIPERSLVSHDLVKFFTFESEVLSKWWDKSVSLKASVLLPSGYTGNPDQKFPVRYNIGGYGSRYTRVNALAEDSEFMDWWTGPEAPQIITVFLDGEGPFGDPYQLDSENSGPYGEALISELIPRVEKEFRISGTAKTRFLDGCSTGGWVSLALQLFYPEQFNGCWSYSPDPVSFRHMQLVNIYQDDNAFYNAADYLIPSMRDVYGNPRFSIQQEITDENVQGYSNTYTTSGGQWGGWNALYSPKDEDGLPQPLFDHETGVIDSTVAAHWENYDLLKYTRANWPSLGPKIQDKIYIWMGDMDNFYLNNAMRLFEAYLSETAAPESNAEIVFSPMKGHCTEYSHRKVLEQIQKRLLALEAVETEK
ncbi:alpha/beta hydrolase-fold protein [Psychroflexus sediminis]|uniref:Putative esterase n=1 Tax=Psychroflexus sediminis TaxID=470826 RepID=A0A1G7VAG2_9FLAO|nr:alpha/beta hydrolase-fold protein [Psychroflexus sediminis]SDG55940.1 Putative esterase [Psychroflexus sediminis]